jgi:hypothetical protein
LGRRIAPLLAGEEPAMRLPSQLEQNKRWNIGILLFLVVAMGFLVYVRYPVFTTEGDSVYAFVTEEDVEVYTVVHAADMMAPNKQFSRVTFTANYTKASVYVSYAMCGPSYNYIVLYYLSKDRAGWHVDGYPKLIQEVFC